MGDKAIVLEGGQGLCVSEALLPPSLFLCLSPSLPRLLAVPRSSLPSHGPSLARRHRQIHNACLLFLAAACSPLVRLLHRVILIDCPSILSRNPPNAIMFARSLRPAAALRFSIPRIVRPMSTSPTAASYEYILVSTPRPGVGQSMPPQSPHPRN